MALRKWLVRSLVFSVVAGLAAAALLYQRWTNPSAVRRQVIDNLSRHFTGATVSVESARLRLLGGIAVSDLRLARRDDLDRTDLAYIPAAVIYHDKEQLLDGKLAIRKVELNRPRIRAIRGRDGRWNLDGILGPVSPDERIPTIVIRQGTIVVEDRRAEPGTPPIEIKDLNLTMVNDPRLVLGFDATGTSDTLGPVRIRGTWQRVTGETELSVEALQVPVGPRLIQHLKGFCADLADNARQLQGTAAVRADVRYRPGTAQPWSHDVRCELTKGSLVHGLLPLPLEQLNASLHVVDGLVTRGELNARSGPTELKLAVKDLAPVICTGSLEDGVKYLELHVKHLKITPDLLDKLPCDLSEINKEYAPNGLVHVSIFLHHEVPGQDRRRVLIQAEDLSCSYFDFPYRIEHIKGTIDRESVGDQGPLLRLDLTGQAGAGSVYLQGEVKRDKPGTKLKLDIWGKDVPLDQKLVRALPEKYQKIANSFHPTGRGDFVASIRREPGEKECRNRYVVTFHDATVRYDVFPYPLENVTGVLDIVQPEGSWEFRDFRGTHKGGEFRTSGRSRADPRGKYVTVQIAGSNILLDEDMERALVETGKPQLARTWKAFAPSGRIDFKGTIDSPPGDGEPDIDLSVFPQGCTVRPAFLGTPDEFRYALDDLRGQVRYSQGWVTLQNLRARHGDTSLGLEQGFVYLKPGGGLWARLDDLWGNPIVPDADFRAALPASLRKGCAALQLRDPLTLRTKMVVDSKSGPDAPTTLYWDGWLALKDARLEVGVPLENVTGIVACRGLHNGRQLEGILGNLHVGEATLFKQPVRDLRSPIQVMPEAPDVLRLPGLHARLFGGEVYGPVRVDFDKDVRFELKLTASQVSLAEFGRHNLGRNAPLSGVATASLHLVGDGNGLEGVRGNGRVDVPSGAKMGRLPVLLDLIKVLGLRPPDRTFFEEAHASFGIRGSRVTIDQLDLFGNLISLRGEGEMNLDGTDLNLDFHADWARAAQVLPPAVRAIPEEISNQLLKLEMRGQVSDVRVTKVPVPLVVDPVKRVMKGRAKIEERK